MKHQASLVRSALFASAALAGASAFAFTAHTFTGGDLAGADFATYNTEDYEWYLNGGTYTLASDLTVNAVSIGMYIGATPMRFSLAGATLRMPRNGYSFYYNLTPDGSPCFVEYTGGTWDFSGVNNDVKLIGPSSASQFETNPAKFSNYHATYSGVTLKHQPTGSHVLDVVGVTGDSSVTFKNGCVLNVGPINSYRAYHTADAAGSMNNEFALIGSTMNCTRWFTDRTTLSFSSPIRCDSRSVIDNSTVTIDKTASISGAGTLEVGYQLAGNTLIVTNSSQVTLGGWGLLLGVNSGHSFYNEVDISTGSKINTQYTQVQIGFAGSSSYNTLRVRGAGTVLNSGSIGVGAYAADGDGTDCRFIASDDATVTSSGHLKIGRPVKEENFDDPVGGYAGNCSATLFGGAKVSTAADVLLYGCANALMLEGQDTALTCANLKLDDGTYHNTGDLLTIRDGAKLSVTSRITINGYGHGIELDNGTLEVVSPNNEWTFYCGYFGDVGGEHKFLFKGESPLLKVTNGAGTAQANFNKGTIFEFELPKGGAYKQAPIQTDLFWPTGFTEGEYVQGETAIFQFTNLKSLLEGLHHSIDICLVEATKVGGSSNGLYFALDEEGSEITSYGCSVKADGQKVVLHLQNGPTVARIQRGSERLEYWSYEDLAAELRDGDTVYLVEDDGNPLIFDGKTINFWTNGEPVQSITLTNAANVTLTKGGLYAKQLEGDFTVTVSDGCTLIANDQCRWWDCNIDLTINNSTFQVNGEYAFYLGFQETAEAGPFTKSVTLGGAQPRLVATKINPETGLDVGQLYILTGTTVTFDLPTDPAKAWKLPAIQAGKTCSVENDVFVFNNLDTLIANMQGKGIRSLKIPLVSTCASKDASIQKSTYELPDSCELASEETETSRTWYLKITLPKPSVATGAIIILK